MTTLDVLSGGRAWLGIGAAWYEDESLGQFRSRRWPRGSNGSRRHRIAHQMWAGDESPFKGRHYQLDRSLNSPSSVRRPHPPILIGGGGEKKTLRLVAKYADACNLFDGPELPHKLEVLREHCIREGRAYSEIEKTVVSALPGNATAAQAVDVCGRLAERGIDHVIFSRATAHDPGAVTMLGSVVEQTRAMTRS